MEKFGAFRIPESLKWHKRSLHASHSGEVHQFDSYEPGGRVVSRWDGKLHPLATVEIVDRTSTDVVLPPSLQDPGKNTKAK